MSDSVDDFLRRMRIPRYEEAQASQPLPHFGGPQRAEPAAGTGFNTDFDGDNWPAATAAGEWKAGLRPHVWKRIGRPTG